MRNYSENLIWASGRSVDNFGPKFRVRGRPNSPKSQPKQPNHIENSSPPVPALTETAERRASLFYFEILRIRRDGHEGSKSRFRTIQLSRPAPLPLQPAGCLGELRLPSVGPPSGLSASLAVYALARGEPKREPPGEFEKAVENGRMVRVNIVPACGFDGPTSHVAVRLKAGEKYLVVDSYVGRRNLKSGRWPGTLGRLGWPGSRRWRPVPSPTRKFGAPLREYSPILLWRRYFIDARSYTLAPDESPAKIEALARGNARDYFTCGELQPLNLF